MSVRDDPVLFLRGGKTSSAGGAVGGGSAVTTTRPHKLDGAEHQAADDTTRLDATTTQHGLMPKLSGDAQTYLDGTGAFTVPAAAIYSPISVTDDGDHFYLLVDGAGTPILVEV